jgi:hypothetical protein
LLTVVQKENNMGALESTVSFCVNSPEKLISLLMGLKIDSRNLVYLGSA